MGRRKLPSIPSYPSYSTIQNYSTNNSALTSSNTTSGYASHQTPSNSIIGSASTWSAGPTGSANAEKNVPISTRGFGSATIMAGSSSYDQNSSLQQHVPVYLSSSAPSTSSAQILTSSAPNLVSAGPIVGTVVQANGMSTSMTSGSASSGYNSGLALYGASAGVPATNVEMTRSSYYTEQPASRPTSALSRPSSALSHISLDTDIISTTSRGDPAIAAGATYQVKPKTAIRQTVSSFVTKQHQPSHHHLVQQSARIPNTLARVLLKKELKEALNRRRETLEACEIEASQRQYVVHKMLVTGLLPENREDDIPRVIRCELPEEIVRGARVIPVQPMSMHLSSTLPKQQPIEQRKSRDQTTSTSFQISSTPVVPPKPPAHANISTMSSTATPPMQHHQQPYFSTSLRQQVESDKYRQFQQKRTAETQTDMTTGDDSGGYARVPLTKERSLSAEPYGIRNPARCFDATVQTQTDLLEATRKYFEDYDRQLKELTEKAKLSSTKQRSFEFHDDDSLSREQRRQQLMEELSRRRERLWQNTQLPSDSLPYRAQFASALHSSDYSSVVPHYGSLPRIDYPSSTPQRRDYTYRSTSLLGNSYDPLTMGPSTYDPLAPAPSARLSRHQQWSSTGASSAMNGRPNAYNYGSLPRNYERCLGQQEPIQIEYEQSFGGKPNTRSLFDIHGIDNISGKDAYGYNVQEMNNARSLNYLDQLHLQQTPSDRLLTLGHHYDGTAPYADRLNNRLANTSNCYTDDAFTLPPYNSQQQDMLSQYANYLSSQFQSNLRSADGTNLASGYPLPNPMPLLSSRYDTGPLSDPYRSTQAIQNSSYPTSRRTVATRYPPSALPPSNIMPNRDGYYPAPMSDPTHVPPMNYHSEYRMPTSQVYSRNEMNYGSRPTHYPTDYGNIGYREALAGRNVMDAYNQNMQQPMAMHPAQQHAAPIQHNSRIPPFASEPASAPIWTSHQPRAQTYQDQNDALSRIYATVGRRRPGTLNPSTPYQSDSPSFIIDGR